MALYHEFLRPFLGLLMSLVVASTASMFFVWAARHVVAVFVDCTVYVASVLFTWLRRVWHVLLVVLLTLLLTSVIFTQIIKHDATLDFGLDTMLHVLARTAALWPTRDDVCLRLLPNYSFTANVCHYWLPPPPHASPDVEK